MVQARVTLELAIPNVHHLLSKPEIPITHWSSQSLLVRHSNALQSAAAAGCVVTTVAKDAVDRNPP